MRSTTVSSKGQVTLPAEDLRTLGIEPGERLLVVRLHDGFVLRRQSGSIAAELWGSLPAMWPDPQAFVSEEREWRDDAERLPRDAAKPVVPRARSRP